MNRSIAEELLEIQKSWTPAERRRRRLQSEAWLRMLCHLLEIHMPVKQRKAEIGLPRRCRVLTKADARSRC